MGQGFLFARPMPATEVDRLLAERTRRARAMDPPAPDAGEVTATPTTSDGLSGSEVVPR